MTARNDRATEATKRLGIEHPIVQGPFGGGLSTARLAATVSNFGGLGSYGAQSLSPDAITAIAEEIRALTSRPFALNLWVSDHDPGGNALSADEWARVSRLLQPYFAELGVEVPPPPVSFAHPFDRQVESLLAANPAVFSFVFGVPSTAILSECKRRHIVTIGAATSIAEAVALDDAQVDLIVATGSEAGGHRPSFLGPAEGSLMGTFVLTQLIAARVRAPVIAAGGIADRRGLDAALALGAQAAQLGTAFLACEESGATAEHRAMLFSERAAHTVLTRVLTGRLARGMRNRITDELQPRAAELPPFPAQGWLMGELKRAAVGAQRTDLVSLWAGQVAPNLHHRRATDLLQSLVEAPPRPPRAT